MCRLGIGEIRDWNLRQEKSTRRGARVEEVLAEGVNAVGSEGSGVVLVMGADFASMVLILECSE
jgi:hypothetical protein